MKSKRNKLIKNACASYLINNNISGINDVNFSRMKNSILLESSFTKHNTFTFPIISFVKFSLLIMVIVFFFTTASIVGTYIGIKNSMIPNDINIYGYTIENTIKFDTDTYGYALKNMETGNNYNLLIIPSNYSLSNLNLADIPLPKKAGFYTSSENNETLVVCYKPNDLYYIVVIGNLNTEVEIKGILVSLD